jgi:hypothetical protein
MKRFSCNWKDIPTVIKYTDDKGVNWVFEPKELLLSILNTTPSTNPSLYTNPYNGEVLPEQVKIDLAKILTNKSCQVIKYLHENKYIEELLDNDLMYQFVKEDIIDQTIKNPLIRAFYDKKRLIGLYYLKDNIQYILDKKVKLDKAILDDYGIKQYFIDMIRMNPGITKKPIEDYHREINDYIYQITQLEYKIHLQPKTEYLFDTVLAVLKTDKELKDCDNKDCITTFKISFVDPEYLAIIFKTNTSPSIVIYPKLGYAKKVLLELIKNTQSKWGSGVTPRGNIKVNDLIYYAGGNWDDKKNPEYKQFFNDSLTLYKNQEPLL